MGIESTNWTWRICLNVATCPAMNSMISSAVGDWLSLMTTNALGTSSDSSSSTPITAESAMAGWVKKQAFELGGRDLEALVFDQLFLAVKDPEIAFSAEGDGFTDAETGSTWNILGEAIDGPMAGKRLTKIVHGDHFWFAWGAFKPDTLIYQGAR